MYALKFYAIAALCVGIALSHPAAAQARLNSNDEVIEFVRANTQERLAALLNYHCTEIISQANYPLTQERRSLSIDHQGRGRIQLSDGRNTVTSVFDGTRAIELRGNSRPDGSLAYSASIIQGMQDFVQVCNEPWRYMGGTLVDELTRVRDGGGRLYAIKLPTGQYRIDIRSEADAVQTLTLDPNQGYVPIERKTTVGGVVQSNEAITFEKVAPQIWFPVEVYSMTAPSGNAQTSENLALKCRFTNIRVNDNSFERGLNIRFLKGTEVFDNILGEYYVVGTEIRRPLADVISSDVPEKKWDTLPGPGNEPWREAFDATYHLKSDEILKYIPSPFIAERADYLVSVEPSLGGQNNRQIQNQPYLFGWNKDSVRLQRLSEHRFVNVSTILENVIQLGSYEYEGPRNLLNLRLTGDWIVRENTSTEQRLKVLKQILEQETRRSIAFVKDSTDDIVIRATGTCRFTPLPNALDSRSVFIQAGNWDARQASGTSTTGNGTTAVLLQQVGNAIGMLIIDETTSSGQELRWTMHESSMLRDIKSTENLYTNRLTILLNGLSSQTGLTFKPEISRYDLWRVTTQETLAAETN